MRINGYEIVNPNEIDFSTEEIGYEKRTILGRLYKQLKATKINLEMSWKGLKEDEFRILQDLLFQRCELVLFDKTYIGYISNLRFKHLANDYYSVSLSFKEE